MVAIPSISIMNGTKCAQANHALFHQPTRTDQKLLLNATDFVKVAATRLSSTFVTFTNLPTLNLNIDNI